MSELLDELVTCLALERLEQDVFRGHSRDMLTRAVFGGQVLAQALSAAQQTVDEERSAHSLHAYFLRPGDVKEPILYHVERIRDGASFATRRVVAVQGGRAIFNLAASFQKREPGFEHHAPMPETPAPELCQSEREHLESFGDRTPRPLLDRVARRCFELRPVDPLDDLYAPTPRRPERRIWLRASDRLGDAPTMHAQLLVYASDFTFVTTSLLPHGAAWLTRGMQIASLDHVMWLHHPVRVDDWLLHVMESPAAQGGRGLVRGRIYTREGKLVASTAQEGLIRKREAP